MVGSKHVWVMAGADREVRDGGSVEGRAVGGLLYKYNGNLLQKREIIS